jgi:hypothetical protein
VVERARARLAEARAEGRLNPDVAPRALLLSRAQQRGTLDAITRAEGAPTAAAAAADDGVTAAVLSHMGRVGTFATTLFCSHNI